MNNDDIVKKWIDDNVIGNKQNMFMSKQRNIHFSLETIYSYGFHFAMAKVVDGVVYVNENKYSVTTSCHQSMLRRELAKAGIQYIVVPFASNQEPIITDIALHDSIAS